MEEREYIPPPACAMPPLSVAPMMAVTDANFRAIFRLISRRTHLYTPMFVDDTILYTATGVDRYLGHHPTQHPLTVQLGGSDPVKLGEAAGMCEAFGGFSEINLNCSCPSKKVVGRCFGARLMLDPEGVRRITHSMGRHATHTPITVKCRIGVDKNDSYEELVHFLATVKMSGVTRFVIHARKGLLKGVSTSGNRNIPPLRYDIFHRLQHDFPDLDLVLNGGVKNLHAVQDHLLGCYEHVDIINPPVRGVMVGRAAYHNMWSFRHTDTAIYGAHSDPGLTRREVVQEYMESHCGPILDSQNNESILDMDMLIKPMTYLFTGGPGNKALKKVLFGRVRGKNGKDRVLLQRTELEEILEEALATVPAEVLDEPVGQFSRVNGAREAGGGLQDDEEAEM